MNRYWYVAVEIFFLMLISLTPFLWLSGDTVLIGHDSGFRLDPSWHIQKLFYTWQENFNFGFDWQHDRGFLIILAPEAFFARIFGGLAGSQAYSLTFWFFLMGISLYGLLLYLTPEKKHWPFRIFASTFYMYNFFILQAWLIAERAKFSLYAALPLAIVILHATLYKRVSSVVGVLLFALLYFFCNGGGSPPLFGATVIAISVTAGLFIAHRTIKYGKKELVSGMLIVLFMGFVTAAVNGYWLFAQYDLARSGYGQAVTQRGGVEGLLAWEGAISVRSSFVNLFRLQGMPSWEEAGHPYAKVYETNPILVIASFIPIASIVLGLLLFGIPRLNKEKHAVFLALLCLIPVGLLLAAGSHPPFGKLYIYLMTHVPGFIMFRSSFYKFAPVVWFSIIVFSSWYISEIIRKVARTSRVLIILSIISIASLLLYHYPYFTKDAFRISSQFNTALTIPSHVEQMRAYIDEETSEDSRILVAPPLDTRYVTTPIDTYTWGYYSLDIFPRVMIHRSFVANDHPNSYLVGQLYDALFNGEQQLSSDLSGRLGIDYILWREDVLYKEPLFGGRSIAQMKAGIELTEVGERVNEAGPWTLYKVHGNTPDEHVTIPQSAIVMDGYNEHATDIVRDEFVGSAALVTEGGSSLLEQIPQSGRSVEAFCVFCRDDEYVGYLSAIHVPPAGKLDTIPFIVKWKLNKYVSNPAHTPGQRIDVLLSKSTYLLSMWRSTSPQGNTYLDQYIKTVEEIAEEYKHLSVADQHVYTPRLFAFLTVHNEALATTQANASIAMKLDELLSLLEAELWVADTTTYRFTLNIPKEGTYRIFVTPPYGDRQITIGTSQTKALQEVFLPAGFQRVSIPRLTGDSTSPHIFFTQKGINEPKPEIQWEKINPTLYIATVQDSPDSFLLQLKEQYDARWTATVTNQVVKTPVSIPEQILFQMKLFIDQNREPSQVAVDGYANGWIIPAAHSPQTIILWYRAQSSLYWGAVLSIAVFITALLYAGYKLTQLYKRTRRKDA